MILAALLALVSGIDEGTITGRLIESDTRQPVSGVRVEVSHASVYWSPRLEPVTTDDLGRFRFERLPVGEYLLTIDSADYWRQSPVPLTVSEGETAELGDVEIRRAGRIEGEIRGPSRELVRGARIALLYTRSEGGSLRHGGPTSWGGYELRGLEKGVYRLAAEAEGYSRSAVIEVSLESGELRTVDLVLRKPVSLRGRLASDPIDSGSKELCLVPRHRQPDSTRLSLLEEEPSAWRFVRPSPGQRHLKTMTRADGTFDFGDIAAGEYELYASDLTGGVLSRLHVSPGETLDLDLLVAPTSVPVRIVDEQGDPIPGAELNVLSPDRLFLLSKRADFHSTARPVVPNRGFLELADRDPTLYVADDDGRMAVNCDPVIEVSCVVGAPGFVTQKTEIDSSAPRTITLVKSRTIEGRLVSPNGSPIAGLEVALEWKNVFGETEGMHRTTDESGSFCAEGLMDGPVRISTESYHVLLPFAETIDLRGGQTTRQFERQLQRGGYLDVTVVGEDGRTAPDVRVVAGPGRRGTVSGYTDADGRVLLGPLPPGKTVVRLSPGRDGEEHEIEATVEVGGEFPIFIRM